jgi:hypothetical protein
MAAMYKKVGVEEEYVFVNWRDWDLLGFFDRMGFSRGDDKSPEEAVTDKGFPLTVSGENRIFRPFALIT